MPKLLHVSDLHIGAPFRRFTGKDYQLREGTKQTLVNVVRIALEDRVDIVLITGDLTDSNQIKPATLNFIIEQLSNIKVPIIILPGTHDCYAQDSIYRRQAWSKLENIYLFTNEQGQSFEFPLLSLAVHGKANMSNKDYNSPISTLKPSPDFIWNVAVAHGSLQIEGKSAEDDYPFSLDELSNCGMDYCALGHWHNFYEIKKGKTIACYAGSASTLNFSEHDSGTVNLVDLKGDGVTITRRPASHYQWITIESNLSGLKSALSSLKNANLLLRVNIPEEIHNEDETVLRNAVDENEKEFFFIDVDYKKSVSQLLRPLIRFEAYPLIDIKLK